MNLPVRDWQFWAVSAAALAGLLFVFRQALPSGLSPFRRRSKGVTTSLTIGGRPARKASANRPGAPADVPKPPAPKG